MKKRPLLFLLISSLLFFHPGFSQTPTTCFEITSVLVDACGSTDGENEMVFFTVGPSPLNTATLTATWPNNSFNGICQNATTANKVAAINGMIISCGHVLEPVGGVLPAGRKVILVTSTDMTPGNYNFQNLQDTVMMIFQCPSGVTGYFRNYQSGVGARTISLHFGPGCSDTVTYVVDSLVNMAGNHAAQDGAMAVFTFAGNASYVNHGCMEPAPPPLSATVAAGNTTICWGDSTTVTATINSGTYSSSLWTGGHGTFTNPASLSTNYTSSSSFSGTDTLVFTAVHCNVTIHDTLFLVINSVPSTAIVASSTTFCTGDSLQLSSSGGSSYVWSTGATTASVYALTTGTYSVTTSSGCGTASASISITSINSPSVTIAAGGPVSFCAGDSVLLTAGGSSPYTWSTGATTTFIYALTTATYSLSATNGCGTSTDTVSVTVIQSPNVNILAGGSATFCVGDSVLLTASGGSIYTWSTGSMAPYIYVSTTGTYSVTSSNACGTSTAGFTVTSITSTPVVIVPNGSIHFCEGGAVTLVATGGAPYIWSTGATSDSIVVVQSGSYSVAGNSQCSVALDTSDVQVDPKPHPVISTSNTVLCPGKHTTLFVSGTDPVLWSTGSSAYVIEASMAGTYLVTATNACGTGKDSIVLTASALNVLFSLSADTANAPYTLNLFNNSTGANSYSWNFGDGGESAETNPEHLYTNAGKYAISLTGTDLSGCSASHIDTLYLEEKPINVYVPNAFSPNGDGKNDVFNVVGEGIAKVHGAIFNRWGEEMASWETVSGGWDGNTRLGKMASSGAYVYIIQLIYTDNSSQEFTGIISLIK